MNWSPTSPSVSWWLNTVAYCYDDRRKEGTTDQIQTDREPATSRIQQSDAVAQYFGLKRRQVAKIVRPSKTARRYYRIVRSSEQRYRYYCSRKNVHGYFHWQIIILLKNFWFSWFNRNCVCFCLNCQQRLLDKIRDVALLFKNSFVVLIIGFSWIQWAYFTGNMVIPIGTVR